MPLETSTEVVDNLDIDVELTRKIVITSGQTLSRGDLVELVTGKAVVFNGNNPYGVMMEDADASGGDITAVASWKAKLKGSEVNFGTGSDTITVRDALAVNGTYLID